MFSHFILVIIYLTHRLVRRYVMPQNRRERAARFSRGWAVLLLAVTGLLVEFRATAEPCHPSSSRQLRSGGWNEFKGLNGGFPVRVPVDKASVVQRMKLVSIADTSYEKDIDGAVRLAGQYLGLRNGRVGTLFPSGITGEQGITHGSVSNVFVRAILFFFRKEIIGADICSDWYWLTANLHIWSRKVAVISAADYPLDAHVPVLIYGYRPTSHCVNVIGNSDIRSNGKLHLLATNTELENADEGINEDEDGSELRPKKLFVVAGFILSAFALALLFKTLNYVYLKPGFNVNVAFGGLVAALGLWLLGGMTLFFTLGTF